MWIWMLLCHFFSLTPAFFSPSSNSVELKDWNALCNQSYETPFSWRQIVSFSEHLFPIVAMYCCDIERSFFSLLQASSMDSFIRRVRLASIGVKVAEVNTFFIALMSSIARWAVKLLNNKQNVICYLGTFSLDNIYGTGSPSQFSCWDQVANIGSVSFTS